MKWRRKHLVSVVAVCLQITVRLQAAASDVNTLGRDGTDPAISSPANKKNALCQTNTTNNILKENILCEQVTEMLNDKHRTTYTNDSTKRFSDNITTLDLNHLVTYPFMYNSTTVSSIDEITKANDVENLLPVYQEDSFIISELSQLCTFTDLCEQPKFVQSKIMESCCKPCSCKADCGGVDMCCFKNGTEEQTAVSAECLYIQPNLPGKTVSIYQRYKIVKQCPPRILNAKHMVNSSFDSFSPVYSTKTHVTYYNHYFAFCNEEDNDTLRDWIRMAACPGFKVSDTYQRTLNDLLYGKCDLLFSPPAGFDLSYQKCYIVDISTCNTTGKWDIYDRNIETACNKLNFPFIPDSRPPVVYANVFCYLCNWGKGVAVPTLCGTIGGSMQWDIVDYVILLSYHENMAQPVVESAPNPDINGCVGYTIFDTIKRRCVDVICPIGMYRNGEGMCVTMIETIHRSRLAVPLRLKRTTDNHFIDSKLNESEFLKLDNAVTETFSSKNVTVCDTQKLIKDTAYKATNTVELLYIVDIKVNNYKLSDLFEDIKQLLHGSVELVIHGRQENVSFDLFHSVLDDLTVKLKFPKGIASIPKARSQYTFLFGIGNKAISKCHLAFPRSVTRLAWCEQVVLDPDDFDPENTEDGSRVFLKASNRYIYHFVLDLDRRVRICVDDYIKIGLFTDSNESKPEYHMNDITRIILILTLFLEGAFLIFALIALWLLRVGRTVTGIQKIHLIITLLLAKSPKGFVMIFGSADRVCSIVGVSVHFFSLSAQFILGMGCLFLSARFKRQQVFRGLALKSSKLAWHFIVTHGAASILVGLNILISIQNSKFQHFGYGTCKNISLIDDEFRYILTLLVPTAAMVTVNGVLLVSYLFCKRPDMDMDHGLVQNTGTIFVYFVLSFIVFITWLCGYFRSNTSGIVFYLFVVLSLLQSIFVGLSFMIKTGQHLRLLPVIGRVDLHEPYQ